MFAAWYGSLVRLRKVGLTGALGAILASACGLALASDPQIASFIDAPDPVAAGGLYTYTIRVDNNSVDAATNTHLIVDVPAGATFVQAAPVAANCSVVNPTRIDCSLGTLGGLGADVREVVLTWRALGPGPATINATATVTATNDINAGNNSQGSITTVISGANLSITKAGTPDPVVGGGVITYTLNVANVGPNDAGSIVVADNLPPAVSFLSATGAGWTCGHSSGVVTCNLPGPLPLAAAIGPITITGKVNASGGTITNSASVAPAAIGGVADPDTSDNTATASTTVLPGADVRIAQKVVSSALPAVAGSNVSFLITARNDGPGAAVNAVVTDVLPAGWTYVTAAATNWTCGAAGQTVTCTRASFPSGASSDITVTATAPANGAISPAGTAFTNTATIASATTDPDNGNNSGSVTFTVLRDGSDLRLEKSKTPNPVAQGSNMTSTIVVTNNGPRTATGPLRVVELLTGETYVAPFPGGGWTCDASAAPVLVCTHPNSSGLPVGSALPALIVTTRADVDGNASNTACTGSSVPPGVSGALASPPTLGDPNGGNDCATTTSRSTSIQPDLSITKSTSTPTGGDTTVSITEGSVTYTLVVTNASATPQSATGVVITDDVPAFVPGSTTYGAITAVVSGGSTATFNCATNNARVTCTQTGGALLRNETVTVTIPVNRPLFDGTYTNTATVGNTAEGDPNAANNQASSPVTIEPIADIEMTGKTVTPTSIRAGEQATYVLSFRNNGPSSAASVVLTDTFTFPAGDSGLTVLQIDTSTPGSTCSIAAGAILRPGQAAYTCTIGTLARGETQTVTLRVRPNFLAPNVARVFTNLVRVDTTTRESPGGGDNGNNTKTATLNITPAQVDLLINKTDRVGAVNLDPVPFVTNAFLGYQVSVTNNGPSYATGVAINETMTPPANRRIRFVCDVTTFGGSTCNTPSLCTPAAIGSTSAPGVALPGFSCSVPAGDAASGLARGDLAVGATKSIWLRFEAIDQPAPTGDVFNNTANVTSNEPDTQNANNTAAEPTTTRQRISLTTSKIANVGNPALMQPFNWTVTVNNGGPGNSLQTDLTDTLPAEAEVTGPITWTKSAPAATGTCTLNGLVITCALGQLNSGGTAVVTVPARIRTYPASGSVTNVATVDTDPIKTGGVDLPGGNNTATSTLPVQPGSSLAGTVFEDSDRTGLNAGTPQSPATEVRLAGVLITLTGTDISGNAITRTATTDVNGNYVFTDLPPSSNTGYTLTQTQPTGYANGPANPPVAGAQAPSLGGAYSAGGAIGNSVYTGVVLGSGVAGVRYNFPELGRARLSGQVYIDVNRDGTRDPLTEAPISGATVRLLNANTLALVATAVTNPDGSYSFSDLDPALVYTLEQPLPAVPGSLINGLPKAGLIAGSACAAGCTVQRNVPVANTDRIANIDLHVGFVGTNFDFGEWFADPPGPPIGSYVSITTTKTPSVANPVLNQPFEWTVTVANGGPGNSLRTDLTDTLPPEAEVTGAITWTKTAPAASGTCTRSELVVTCALGQLNAGAKAVVTVPVRIRTFPSGGSVTNIATVDTDPTKTGGTDLPGGNNTAVSTVPIKPASSLAGTVFVDNNRNGSNAGTPQAADGEPRIAGVAITLTGTDFSGNPVSRTAITDPDGNYLFTDLPASNGAGYTLTQTQPGGYVNGPVDPPSAGILAPSIGGSTYSSGGVNGNSSYTGIVLGGGVAGVRFNFPEINRASLSGQVYVDLDRNGVRDAVREPAIAGATVRLLNANTLAVVATTLTGADGSYSFTNLDPAVPYTLEEPLPTSPASLVNGLPRAGLVGGLACASGCSVQRNVPATDTDRIAVIDISQRLVGTNFDFGEFLRDGATLTTDISGTVYIDRLRNGTLDPEPSDGRIPGVTVRLVDGPSCSAGTVLQTVVTDAAGRYVFPNVTPQRDYLICEEQPVGYGQAAENPGTAGTTAGTDAIRIVNLPIAGSGGNNFGERLGSLAGNVWLDRNDDGTRSATEPGIPGVTVTLSGLDAAGRPVSRSTQTDSNGEYRFDDLLAAGPAGYTVTEQAAQPVVDGQATVNGKTVAGSTGGTASGVGTLPSVITGIALPAGGASTANNFAEIRGSSAIEGRVWLDPNNNGVIDANETGIAGVRIELSGTDGNGNAVTRTATTDADGRWRFDNLPAGTYQVLEPTQPPSTANGLSVAGSTGGTATPVATLPSAIASIVLPPDTVSSANNFGELPSGSISGLVYVDNDNNGQPGANEPGIPGVVVVLTGTDDLGRPVQLTTTTGPDGRYVFDGLRPGTYTVTEPTQPAGTSNGITTPGNLGGTASGTATTPSTIASIVLPVGGRSVDNNFGERTASPDLRAAKSLLESGLTVGFAGHYRITVRNVGDLPTTGSYTLSDRLPTGVTLAAAPTGSGWTCTGSAGATSFNCSSSALIAPGASAPVINAKVNVAASAVAASPVHNAVLVEGGGEGDGRTPTATERDQFNNTPGSLPACVPEASASQNSCRVTSVVQLPATLSGTVWLDGGSSTRLLDTRDTRLPGWLVEVVDPATGQVVGTATTGTDGTYQVKNLPPGTPLVVRFRDPGTGIVVGYPVNGETAPGSSGASCDANAAASGKASSCVGSGASPWLTVILASGKDLPQQSLPVDANVVYDSGTRTAVAGAVVTLAPSGTCVGWNPQTGIVGAALGGYTVSGSQVSMTTGSSGLYQFILGPGAPASCTFTISVKPPAGYTFESQAIPATPGTLQPAGTPGTPVAVQPQAGAPTGAVGSATTYYLAINAGSSVATVVHNHIPLDPALPTSVSLGKTGDKSVVEIGDLVRYTITVTAASGALPRQTTVLDNLPRGFTYVPGTATVGGVRIADPQGGLGPALAFNLGAMPASRQLVLQYRVRVGVGAAQGDGVNRASAIVCGVPEGCVDATLKGRRGSVPSGEAAHRVRIAGGVFATEACVAGKIFMDCNGNHVQDPEELGIPGVRLVMQDGTTLVSDSEGKYSACGLPPKSAVLKVDPLTLPRGSRLTTSSNRNLGDAGSLWLDLKNGELVRGDFVEGSCSNTVLEQVKARRAQGEVRSPETERKGGPALRFDSKAHGLNTLSSPQQGTDSANQRVPAARPTPPPPPRQTPTEDESNVPTPALPMNRPATEAGARNGTR